MAIPVPLCLKWNITCLLLCVVLCPPAAEHQNDPTASRILGAALTEIRRFDRARHVVVSCCGGDVPSVTRRRLFIKEDLAEWQCHGPKYRDEDRF